MRPGNEQTVLTAAPEDMEVYYSKEQQQRYGAAEIEIEVIQQNQK